MKWLEVGGLRKFQFVFREILLEFRETRIRKLDENFAKHEIKMWATLLAILQERDEFLIFKIVNNQ